MATNQAYVSTQEAAAQHGLSLAWVKRQAARGLIPGAFKIGQRGWCIPADWTPQRQRRKPGG